MAALKSRTVLSMLATAAVIGLGTFGAPAPAQAGGTKIVVATPGVFVAIGDHRPRYRDYGYKDSRYKDSYRRDFYKHDRGYRRHRDYDRSKYRDRGYSRGGSRYDCDRRGRRYRR